MQAHTHDYEWDSGDPLPSSFTWLPTNLSVPSHVDLFHKLPLEEWVLIRRVGREKQNAKWKPQAFCSFSANIGSGRPWLPPYSDHALCWLRCRLSSNTEKWTVVHVSARMRKCEGWLGLSAEDLGLTDFRVNRQGTGLSLNPKWQGHYAETHSPK